MAGCSQIETAMTKSRILCQNLASVSRWHQVITVKQQQIGKAYTSVSEANLLMEEGNSGHL